MEKGVLREWRLAQPVWTTTRLGEAIGLRTTLEPLAVWRQRHARKSRSRTWVTPATSCSPTALARGLFTRLRGVRTQHRPPHVDRRKKLRSLLPFERYLSRDRHSNILHIQTRSRHPMRRPMGWPRTDMGQVTSQDAVALSQAQANLASVTQKQHIHIDLGTERATCTLQASLLFPPSQSVRAWRLWTGLFDGASFPLSERCDTAKSHPIPPNAAGPPCTQSTMLDAVPGLALQAKYI